MGAGQSIPAGMPSREAFKSKTVPTQTVVNSVFLWMLGRTDIQDLLKLADQRRCKDYVFFTQRALQQFFSELQLEPKLGAKNTLYFEKMERLTFATEESLKGRGELKAYRDSLCLQLAFFYVRIIQIFGALALTVIDSLPERDSQSVDFRAGIQAQVLGRRAPPPGFVGGATEEDRTDLGEFYTVAKNYFTAIPGTDYYVISSSQRIPRDPTTAVNTLMFNPSKTKNVIYRPRIDILVEASISIENLRPGESYTLRIDDITVNANRKDTTYNFSFKATRSGDYSYNNTTFSTAIATVMGNAARGQRNVQQGRPEDIRRRVEGPSDDAGVVQGLSYSGIFKYLKEKPKAYCVARAIQLLSPTLVDSMRKDTPLSSGVCFYSAMPGIPDSVPNYGQVITKHSPGLRALNQLFFDMIQGNVPKISEEVKPKHKQFVELMQVIFAPPPPNKDAPDQLDKVISKAFSQCETTEFKDKEIIMKNADAIRKVRTHIASLLSFQIKHTANVMQFLPKIFIFDKEGIIKGLQPALMKEGIPRVNILANEARNMLSEYYKFCEGTYRLGALEVLRAPGSVGIPRPKTS
jgi:hypothetical protein